MKKTRFLAALLLIVMLFTGNALAGGYVEVGATVHVRSGPGLNYEDIGTAHESNILMYLDESATDSRGVVWYCVDFDGEEGWVSSKYTVLFGDIYVYAVEGRSFIRKNPDLEAKQLAILYEGESAEYLGRTSVDERGVAWYKVEYDGEIGWVSSKYTVLGEEGVIYNRYILADEGKAHIRDNPSLDGESLEILPQGDTATYLEKKEWDERGVAWYKVRYEGTVGWVSSKYTVIYEDGNSYSSSSGKDLIDFSDFFVSSSSGSSSSSSSSSSSWYSSSSSSSSTIKTRCSKCGGDGEISCTNCGGSGYKTVYGSVPNYSGKSSTSYSNKETCYKCHGSGEITCTRCGGSGTN